MAVHATHAEGALVVGSGEEGVDDLEPNACAPPPKLASAAGEGPSVGRCELYMRKTPYQSLIRKMMALLVN